MVVEVRGRLARVRQRDANRHTHHGHAVLGQAERAREQLLRAGVERQLCRGGAGAGVGGRGQEHAAAAAAAAATARRHGVRVGAGGRKRVARGDRAEERLIQIHKGEQEQTLRDGEDRLAAGLGRGPLVARIDPVGPHVAAVEGVALMDSLDVIDGEVARVVVLAEDHLHEARLAALVLGPVMVLVITLAARARARPLALQQQHLVRQTIADKVVRLSQDLHRSGPGRTPTHGVGARPDVPPRDAALEGEAARGARGVEGADGEQVRGRLQHRDALPALHAELERAVELVPVSVEAVGV
mmetsp:Transcript_30342/g.46625  ORF Transcript_30342/g.46625 Transcript_30342/m.46625 type:complete len:299 (+) Transcript_30342:625-1521(+)